MMIDILKALTVEQKVEIYKQSGHRIAFCDFCGECFVGNTAQEAELEGFQHIAKKHTKEVSESLAKVLKRIKF